MLSLSTLLAITDGLLVTSKRSLPFSLNIHSRCSHLSPASTSVLEINLIVRARGQMSQQPFRYPSGTLHREQSICLASKTRQLIDSEADACYHFRKLFADSWLSSQIAFVQVRSFNPPSLLLKPCKPNSFNSSSWEELRSWISHRGFNSGWSATVCSLASRTCAT